MERRRKKLISRLPLLKQMPLLIATLVGTVASIVLLILFRWKQAPSPPEPRDAEPDQPSTIEDKPSVEDDDPRIFNLRTFGYFAIFMVGLIGFVLVAGALLSGFFLPGNSIVITPAPTLLPPPPRLESNSGQIFPVIHATQEAELNSYGWVDQKKGIVHIPIERAMELLAKSNLPVVAGTPIAVTPSAP